MKKCFLTIMALILGTMMLQANPVDVNRAKLVGQQYALTTMNTRSGELNLVYSAPNERGGACFYVFNVGTEGFVIVSGDDYYRPIVGYSLEGPFDAENPGLAYYLRTIQRGRSNRNLGQAEPQVAAEWENVISNGRQFSRNGGHVVGPLCQTKWDQNYPYNSLCPPFACSGGHFYAGCVATAMGQVMKYWNHPLQGQGSHSYYPPAHPITATHPVNVPSPGTQSANFGATTYDWENMPISLSSSTPQEQIDAVATLLYHCAVSVDMDWDYDGSGAHSEDVPGRIAQYFRYASQAVLQRRANFGATWADKVRESLDMGWPLYYSGYEQTSSGLAGHAFVLDGYDDDGMFYFNFGWSGSGNGPYTFDGQDYNYNDGAIFNFVPQEVYNNTPQAPTNLTVTPAANYVLSATLNWTNPTKTMNNQNLAGIDQIVVLRGHDIIAVIDNPAPGAAMTFVDNEVPRFDVFKYTVYAVSNGNHGKNLTSADVNFGPLCNWTITMGSSHMQGWRGGYVSIYNAAGSLIRTCTTTSSSMSNVAAQLPLGRLSFAWTAPTEALASMNLLIKDSQGNTVYSYNGASTDLPEGVFLVTNNSCGTNPGTSVPSNLLAIRDEENVNDIMVSWDGVNETGYGYNVYRDGLLYRLVTEGTSFLDQNTPIGGHCYYASFLGFGGENLQYSNEYCATSGEGCNPPRNFDYEFTAARRVKLKWEKPVVTDGLSANFIYRKAEGDADYTLIKIASATATSYTDVVLPEEGIYYYKIVAYYQDIDCYSAPANRIWTTNRFFLQVYYSPSAVNEWAESINVYPNPTKDSFTVEGEDLLQVTVYNTLGQLVYTGSADGNRMVINLNQVESGLYLVKVLTSNGETVKRISVIR